MKKFLSEIADETVDLKSLGIGGTDKQKMTDMLYRCYGLKVKCMLFPLDEIHCAQKVLQIVT
ncbi:MAG TPA: hypothetical protein DCX93_02680 [Butyrivibrio sp.]|nr:hypothetical protein [Butyrivibrio sp.]